MNEFCSKYKQAENDNKLKLHSIKMKNCKIVDNILFRKDEIIVDERLKKLSQSQFFFLISIQTQLSAYANHEFKIILISTQLSAYANHELKNRCYIVKVTKR